MAIYVQDLFIIYVLYNPPQSWGFDVITILKIIKPFYRIYVCSVILHFCGRESSSPIGSQRL